VRARRRAGRRGVAYITLAHLFWRRVATNSIAVPLPERLYRLVFPQPLALLQRHWGARPGLTSAAETPPMAAAAA
jgi:hypothetical protein